VTVAPEFHLEDKLRAFFAMMMATANPDAAGSSS
jgi:hypothetical protein